MTTAAKGFLFAIGFSLAFWVILAIAASLIPDPTDLLCIGAAMVIVAGLYGIAFSAGWK